MGNIGVIDLSILPPLVDLISYRDLQTATVLFKAQIALIFRAAILRAGFVVIILFKLGVVGHPYTLQ